jgi:hypothetical protein
LAAEIVWVKPKRRYPLHPPAFNELLATEVSEDTEKEDNKKARLAGYRFDQSLRELGELCG